jgi:hypothetical protein
MSSTFYTKVQSPPFAAAAGAVSADGQEEYHQQHGYDSGSAPTVTFIQQITGASYPKTWDELTDQEQKKVLAVLFQEGLHTKKVSHNTIKSAPESNVVIISRVFFK